MYERVTSEPSTSRISRKELLARACVGLGIGALFIAVCGAIAVLVLLSSGSDKGEGFDFSAVDLSVLIFTFGIAPVVGIGIGLILIGSNLFPEQEDAKTQGLEQSPPTEQPTQLAPVTKKPST